MTAKIIMLGNQKGGVGKTTTAVNIATIIAASNYKTLLIDFDPQGNSTSGINGNKKHAGTYEWMTGSTTTPIQATYIPHLNLISANMDLAAVDIELMNKPNREFILRDKLTELSKEYDYILIDCPPSLGLLTVNALTASSHIVIPMQCEYYALEGISHIMQIIQRVQGGLNPRLQLLGILLTMYDKRSTLNQQIANDIRFHFQQKVFSSVIPRNVKIAEAPSHGKPIILYDVKSTGAISYMDATKELLARINSLEAA
jgi:chromosome partitioning protein